jgi:hypothetical protein
MLYRDRSPVPARWNVLHYLEKCWRERPRLIRGPLKVANRIPQRRVSRLPFIAMGGHHRLNRVPITRKEENHPAESRDPP